MILFSCGDEMHVDEREEEAFRAQVQVNNNVYKTRSTLTFHTFHFSAYFAQTFDFSNGHLSFLSLLCPDPFTSRTVTFHLCLNFLYLHLTCRPPSSLLPLPTITNLQRQASALPTFSISSDLTFTMGNKRSQLNSPVPTIISPSFEDDGWEIDHSRSTPVSTKVVKSASSNRTGTKRKTTADHPVDSAAAASPTPKARPADVKEHNDPR